MTDVDDIWDDDPFADDEPQEPDCCDFYGPSGCFACRRHFGRAKRRNARFWRQFARRQQKVWRHRNDRPWLARNRGVFDDSGPF